jgi:hypothetical protein
MVKCHLLEEYMPSLPTFFSLCEGQFRLTILTMFRDSVDEKVPKLAQLAMVLGQCHNPLSIQLGRLWADAG